MSRTIWCQLLPGALALALATGAAAVPLGYAVVPSESNLSASFGLQAFVDATPDFTENPLDPSGEFPLIANAIGSTSTQPTPASRLTADVGLPGSFDDGANGISFSELQIDYAQVPGGNIVFGLISVPLDLTGSPGQLVALSAQVSRLNITLDAPFSSDLTPTGTPDQWLWSGLADVTISGELRPQVSIPGSGMDPVGLEPTPFSQSTTMPLFGTFSGDASATQVSVGIPVDALENLDLSLPDVEEQIALLDALGIPLVTLDVRFGNLVLGDTNGSVVFRTSTPIPEPASAALLALGLAGMALRRRSR